MLFYFLILKYLLFICVFMAIGYFLGKIIVRNKSSLSTAEICSLTIASGWAILAILIMLMGFLGILRSFLLTSVILIIIFCSLIFKNSIGTFRFTNQGETRNFTQLQFAFLVLILTYFFLLFYLALYPVTAWDALSYHLPVAGEFISQQRIAFLPFIRFPVHPQMMETFFVFALMLGDTVCVALTQYSMAVILCILIYSFVKKYISQDIGLLSAVIFISSPLVAYTSIVPYVEIGSTLFCFSAFYTMYLWLQEKKVKFAILSGLFWGIALGSKYYTILFFALVSLSVIIFLWHREVKKSHLLLFLLALLVVALPWYLRNRYYSGDWFFPLFLDKVGARGIWDLKDLDIQINDIRTHGLGYTVRAFFILPLNLLLHSAKFGEKGLGFFLLLSFCSPFLMKKWTRLIAVMAAIASIYIVIWFKYFPVTRYLFPVLPFLSILSAWFLEKLCSRFKYLVSFLAVVVITIGLTSIFNELKINKKLPLVPDEQFNYLSERIPTYRAIDFLNKMYDGNKVVYIFYDEGSLYYHKNKVIGDVYGPLSYRKILPYFSNPNTLYAVVRQYNVKYFLVRKDKFKDSDIINIFKNGKFKIVYEDSGSLVIEIPH